MPSSLYCLLYASRPVVPVQPATLAAILRSSRDRNAAARVTGILAYHSSLILQALEGRSEAVNQTFQRISRDRRHQDVTLLSYEAVAKRRFARWPMGYAALTTDVEQALRSEGVNSLDAVFRVDAATGQRLLLALKARAARVDLPPNS